MVIVILTDVKEETFSAKERDADGILENLNLFIMNIVAVTSTTILPKDGAYKVETLNLCPEITGVLHYVGHPATKEIVESKGAVPASSKLFNGLEIGESQICFAIKQGMSDRSQGGTAMNQDVSEDMLSIRAVTRIG